MGAVSLAKCVPVGVALVLGAPMVLAQSAPPSSRPAQAPDAASRQEAQQRFRRGLELYDENDFRGALIEFERAYELAPAFRVLYNIGQVRYQLRDYAGAVRAFEQYLADGGKQVDRRRRAEVEREIVKLRSRVATVSIGTSVPGAEVFIDDVLVGTTPLSEPIVVSAGRRKVTASKKGYTSVTRAIDVAGADSIELQLELAAAAPRPTATPPVGAASQPNVASSPATRDRGTEAPAPRQVPWVAWGVSGALAIGATVTGVLALNASSDLADKRAEANVGRDALDSAESKTSNLALATDILGGAAIVVGGYAAWRTLLAEPSQPEESPAGTVQVGLTPRSVVVRGAF